MAAESPVITTTVGGIPEIVADGESDYLIESNDGASLREAIEALLANASRWWEMGARGRAIAEERFDASKNARRLIDCVYHLAGRHTAARSR
jgi:glycosyltransferase involved in cell wall biosynthesis